MPKKVLIFSLVYYPRNIGGAEVAIKEITDRISEGDFQFDMITLGKGSPDFEKIGKVNVYRTGPTWLNKTKIFGKLYKYLFIFSAFFKALELHKKNKYDLVWSMMANYAGFSSLFFKLLNPKVPFLLTLQEGDPIDYIKKRVALVYPIFKMIFKKADAIQAISYYLASFGKSMGFKGSPIVIPNGVDTKLFTQDFSVNERSDLRKELRLGNNDIALITTSRLVAKNGVGDVIKALPNLEENIKFVILGEGGLREDLESLAKDLEVMERVVFKGYIDHSEMPKYLKTCDIFIRPSLSEGLGNSFIEAMAAGLQVIATPVGGIIDFLHEGETGYFCKPENPESIVETVNFVLKDPNKEKIVGNAKKMAIEKYNWENITLQMKEIFNSLK